MDNGFFSLLQILKIPSGDVTSCDLNLNYLLATGSSDRLVRVLEWKVGLGFVDVSYSPLRHHKLGVTSVRFSPKGTMLASASIDGTAVLVNVSTGSTIFTMVQYNTTSIRCCEFTFDSTRLITAGDDGIFCFWDLVHHCQIRNCRLHEEEFCVRGLAISPDSEYLLSADSGNFLKLWFIGDVSISQPECLLVKKNFHDGGIFSCDFSSYVETSGYPRVQHIYFIATCGADSLIRVLKIVIERNRKGEVGPDRFSCDIITVHELNGHTNDVLSVRFNSTGTYLVSTGLDNLIKLWKIFTGECLETLREHTSFGTCSTFSKDPLLLVTGSNDKSLIVWDMTRNLTLDSQLMVPCNTSSHFTNVDLINYSNKTATVDQRKKFNQFTVIQKLNILSVTNSVHIHGNILAVAGGDKSIAIWKRQEGSFLYERIDSVEHHKYSINHLEISPCGSKVISSSKDGVIIFWDLNMKLTHEMRIPGSSNSLRTCRFSPNSEFIAAAGDDQEVFLWNTSNLEFVKTIQRHDNAITSVAFSPESKYLVSSCCEGSIKLYSFEEDKSVFELNNAHDLGAMCCDVSGNPDCEVHILATCGNDSLVKLWEVKNSKIVNLGALSGHKGVVNYVRFSPSVPFILASCASDTTVRIWHGKARQCLHVLSHHQSTVTTCSFAQDSNLFVTGSWDKTVLIWQQTEQAFHEETETNQNSSKLLQYWTTTDIANWFRERGFPETANKINLIRLDGMKLLHNSDESLLHSIGFGNEEEYKALKANLHWLRIESTCFTFDSLPITEDMPHNFLCPITHKIMKNPVICSDGFVYDKAAITEWFLSGKFTSPMTNEHLKNTKLLSYSALKKNIYGFLLKNKNKEFRKIFHNLVIKAVYP